MTGIRSNSVQRALVERLELIPRFSGVSPRIPSLLAMLGAARRLAQGEQILEEGSLSPSLFIVLSGKLKMARALPNGRSAFLGLLTVGDLIGVSGLGGKCDATVTAHEASLCLEVPWSDLLTVLEHQSKLVAELLPLFVERVAECRHCVLEAAFYRVESRLACLLLKLMESFGEPGPESDFLRVALSRQDLADMVGTTVETSIRIMSRWGKEGVLETQDGGFVLRDRQALEAICRPQ